jgi:hypothetical protein
MYLIITILALISFISFKIYQSVRVPKELKDVPTLSFLNIVKSIIAKSGQDKIWESMREVLEKVGIGKVIIFFYLVTNI